MTNDQPSHDTIAAARDTLARQGIPFDEQRALAYVRKGDAEIVRTFLAAGLRPDVSDDAGVPALTIAGRLGYADVCGALIASGADATLLVDALKAKHRPSKDAWDRFASLSGLLTFSSTLLVAAVGWHFTNAYNDRQQLAAEAQAKRDADIRSQQARVSEMDTVVKLIPYLTTNEDSKKAALLAMSELATPKLAVQMAQLFGGVGSVQALETIAQQQSPSVTPGAVSALAQLASQGSGASGQAADAASLALGGIFKGKERALVRVLSGNSFICNAFIADLGEPAIVTPTYCADPKKGGKYTVSLWDSRDLPVTKLTPLGGFTRLHTAAISGLTALKLSDSLPAIGATLLKVAYGVDFSARGDNKDRLSVIAGKVEAVAVSQRGSFPGVDAKRDQFIDVRLTNVSKDIGGEGGGPMLDASGAVSCIVYLSGADPAVETCLSTRSLRAGAAAAT